MRLTDVLASALALLREHPVLFLPRFGATLLSSVLWILLLDAVSFPLQPAAVSQLGWIFLAFLLLIPVQVWVYNLYFFVVQQDGDRFDLAAAARNGLKRVPHGVGGTLVPMLVLAVVSVPPSFVAAVGIRTGSLALTVVGLAGLLVAVFAVAIRCYFVPVAAVLGDESFRANIRAGLSAARQRQRGVTALTALSFLVLVGTLAVEGVLEQAGMAGFLLGRFLSATVSVYLLIVNPELYLAPVQD